MYVVIVPITLATWYTIRICMSSICIAIPSYQGILLSSVYEIIVPVTLILAQIVAGALNSLQRALSNIFTGR